MKIAPVKKISGELTVPGDKSISHRAIMLGSIAKGDTEIDGFLESADCLSTAACFARMGIKIEKGDKAVTVRGRGLHGLKAPDTILDCGNSGTTVRLLSGLLAPQNFDTTLTGDASIQKRPMKRIMDPLAEMGAKIQSINENGCAPLKICGGPLTGIRYVSPVASAQVKSAVLLAGLYADGATSVTEPSLSRNHTELMLSQFGGSVTSDGLTAKVLPANELYGQHICVPGDISSAAYFIAAALLLPHSEVLIQNVGVNKTRAGILEVCRQMGAVIEVSNASKEAGDPRADLFIRSASLKGITVGGPIIPTLIDELPMIAAMACFAEGTTVIRDAAELRVKESNRIAVMVNSLRAMGADIEETEDGMRICGGRPLHGVCLDTHKDHRIAMTLAVTALAAEGETELLDADCVRISYPGFYEDLARLTV
ncbi:MAG: 3-phosphoshikimate 1-carboxyvinyltransferase [Lachnospiraceae bacterium]|nr:3-phosphoshikimate 1-carboxyvinyltransferase [Lachnospiraceae bacterium]